MESWSEVALSRNIYIGSWTVKGNDVVALVSGSDEFLEISANGTVTSWAVELRSAGAQGASLQSLGDEVVLNALTMWKLDD